MPKRPRRETGPRGGETTRTPGGFIKTTLYLSEDLKRALARFAAETGRSDSDVLREALAEYLEKQRPEK